MSQRSQPDGHSLKTLRESFGLSQSDLAAQTGYSAKTIQRWESGQGQPRQAVIECLHNLRKSQPIPEPSREQPLFTFVDLFAGIGGMRLAFESVGGQCIFTSEWNKYAQITYRTNFGEQHPIAGDIVQIPSDLIPAHDVLVAGFPCQPFSIAGVSKKNALGRPHGFECDTQGTLFFDVERIIAHHHPRVFLLENVRNLVNHDQGRTFETIYKVL